MAAVALVLVAAGCEKRSLVLVDVHAGAGLAAVNSVTLSLKVGATSVATEMVLGEIPRGVGQAVKIGIYIDGGHNGDGQVDAVARNTSNCQVGFGSARQPIKQGGTTKLMITVQPTGMSCPGGDAGPDSGIDAPRFDSPPDFGQGDVAAKDFPGPIDFPAADSPGPADMGFGELPPGCPPGYPNEQGVGKPCSRGGGECMNNGAATACTCDPQLGMEPSPGTPCFCTKASNGTCPPTHMCGSMTKCCNTMTMSGFPYWFCIPEACFGAMGPPPGTCS